MILLNYNLVNDVVFYCIFIGVVGAIGYLFLIFPFNFFSDSTQISIWEDSSDSTQISTGEDSSDSTQTSTGEDFSVSASPSRLNLDIQSVSDINVIFLKKILEIMELYPEQLLNHGVTTSQLSRIILSLPIERLSDPNLNELILTWINSFGG